MRVRAYQTRLISLLLVCSCLSMLAQPNSGWMLTNDIRIARMILKARQPGLTEAELDKLAFQVGSSNHMARSISDAFQRRDLAQADELLKQFPGTINDVTLYGQPVMWQAVQSGDEVLLGFLLEHKADPNSRIQNGQTPLCQAVQFNRLNFARKLIEGGASVNATNQWGQRPLGLLTQNLWGMGGLPRPGNTPAETTLDDLAVLMIESGADPFLPMRSGDNQSILEEALNRQDPAIIELLLTNKPNSAKRTPGGQTALHLAAVRAHTNAIAFLIGAGIAADQTNSDGLTPLQFIAHMSDQSGEALVKSNGLWLVQRPAVTPFPARIRASQRVWRGPGFGGGLQFVSSQTVAAQLLNSGAKLDICCAAGLGITDELAEILRSQTELVNTSDPLGWTALHYAISAAQPSSARLLLDKGGAASARTTKPFSRSPYEALVPASTTPLHLAALRGANDLILLLLRVQANIAATDTEGNTPAHLSARQWQTNCLASLIAAHAPLELTNNAGEKPLLIAVKAGPAGNVSLLLDSGARPELDPEGETLLHTSALTGNTDVATVLLRHGFKLDSRDKSGRTPFRLAAAQTRGQGNMLAFLLSKGADINAADKDGNTALHETVAEQNDQINYNIPPSSWESWKQKVLSRPGVSQATLSKLISWKLVSPPTGTVWTNMSLTAFLLQNGAKASETNRLGETPLHILCKQSWIAWADQDVTNRLGFLLNAGAKVEAADVHAITPLHIAATNVSPEVIGLLGQRARVGQTLRDAEGQTPLHYAARVRPNGDDETRIGARVAALLKAGFDPNVVDKRGRAALHEAVASHLEQPWPPGDSALSALLTNKANPNLQDNDGFTPLELAVKGWRDHPNGDPSVVWREVSVLLTNGANPNLPDTDGHTALHLIAGSPRISSSLDGNLDRVLALGSWDATIRDKRGDTPLHLLSSNLYPHSIPLDGMKRLLTNSAAVNLTNSGGDTPLHIAIRSERYHIAKALMDAGANPALRNTKGESAWRLAAAIDPGGMTAQTVRPPGASQGFFHAISSRDDAALNAWFEADSRVCSVTNVYGETPLMAATSRAPYDLAERLLKMGAPMDIWSALRLGRMEDFSRLLKAHSGDVPPEWLFEAVRRHRSDALREMVEARADVNSQDDEGHSLLYRASSDKSTEAWLEEKGCRKTIFDSMADGDRQALEKFLNADSSNDGARVNTANGRGRTLLILAVVGNWPNLASLLIANKADLKRGTGEGWTALHFAAALDRVEIAEMLLRAGADPNELAANGMGPLHIAAAYGQTNIAALLLTNGAIVNLRPSSNGSFGNTPLHWAAHRGGVAVVKMLLDHGADPKATNNNGTTPLDFVGPNNRGGWYAFPAPGEALPIFRRSPKPAEQAAIRQAFTDLQQQRTENALR